MQATRPWQNDTDVDPVVLVQPSAPSLTVSGTSSTFSGWPTVGQGLKGRCDDMCPLEERRVRMQDREVAAFEKEGGPTDARVRDLMVKRFARSSAGHENTIEQLRTPATLGATMQYLTCNVLDADSGAPDARFARDGPAQPPSLLQVYNFLFDRTRGIRSDYSSQGYGTGRNDALVMQVYEQIARFHVLANYELCENKEFQRGLNEKELAKALKTLFDLYDDGHRQHEQAVSKRRHAGASEAQARRTAPHLCSPHEAEMRAFHVLVFMLKDDENTSLSSFLQRCRPEVLQAPPMQYALRAMALFKGGLHASFLRLMKTGPYLLACLMHRALPDVRIKAAQSLNAGYHVKQDLVLDYVGKQLGAASRAEALSLAQALNLNVLGRGSGHCVRSDRRAEAPQLKNLPHALVPQLMPPLPMATAGMGRRRSIVCKDEWALRAPLPVFGKGAALMPEQVAALVRGLGGSGEEPDAYESSAVLEAMQQQQQQQRLGAYSGAGQAHSDEEASDSQSMEDEEDDSELQAEEEGDEDEDEDEDSAAEEGGESEGVQEEEEDVQEESDASGSGAGVPAGAAPGSSEEEGGSGAAAASSSPSSPSATGAPLALRPVSPPHASMLLPGKPLPLTPVADAQDARGKPNFGASPFTQGGSAASAPMMGGLLGTAASIGAAAAPPASSTVTHATGLTLPCVLGLLSPSAAKPAPLLAPPPAAAPPRSLFSAAPSLLSGTGAPSAAARAATLGSGAAPSLLPAGAAQVMSTANGSLSTGASLLPSAGRPGLSPPALLGASQPAPSVLAATRPPTQAEQGVLSLDPPLGQTPKPDAGQAGVQEGHVSPPQAETPPPPSPPSPPPPPEPVVLPPRSWDQDASRTAAEALAVVLLATGAAVRWEGGSVAAGDGAPERSSAEECEEALQWQHLLRWLRDKTPRPKQCLRTVAVTLMPRDAELKPSTSGLAVYPCTAAWQHCGEALPAGAIALPTRRHMPTKLAGQCLLVDDCGVWEALRRVAERATEAPRQGPHPLLEHAALPLLDELVALHHRCSAAQVLPQAVAAWLAVVAQRLQAAVEVHGPACSKQWVDACERFVATFQRLPNCVPSLVAMQACAAAVAELSAVALELPLGDAAALPPLPQPDPGLVGPLVRLPQEPERRPVRQDTHTPEQEEESSMLQDISVLDWSFSSTAPPLSAEAPAAAAHSSPKKRRRSSATVKSATSRKQRRRSRGSGKQPRSAAVAQPTWRDVVQQARAESAEHDVSLDHVVDEVCVDLLQ